VVVSKKCRCSEARTRGLQVGWGQTPMVAAVLDTVPSGLAKGLLRLGADP
jgi:hypothetical protein